jgi:hypothetical protein
MPGETEGDHATESSAAPGVCASSLSQNTAMSIRCAGAASFQISV